MKKYALVSLILILAGAFFLLRKTPENKPKLSQTPSRSLKEVVLGQRTVNLASTPVQNGPCESLLNVLDQVDFNQETKTWLPDLKEEGFVACGEETFAARVAEIRNDCFGLKGSRTKCTSHLIFLRAMVRMKYRLDENSDEGVADAILNEFSKKDLDFKRLEPLTRRLLDSHPTDQVQKLWAMARLLSQKDLEKLSSTVVDEIYSRIDPNLLTDSDMKDMNLILKTGLKPDKIEAEFRSALATKPKDAHSHEMLGWSLWKQNRRDEAIMELKTAIKLNPKDERLQNMLKAVNAADANTDSYKVRIQINLTLSLQDLFS